MIGPGRPPTHPIKKVIRFNVELIAAINKWRKKQKPMPNYNEAVRQLIERGLRK
jgi:hypothetical protein